MVISICFCCFSLQSLNYYVIKLQNDFFNFIIFVNYILSSGLVGLRTVRLLVQVFTLVRGGCENHKCHYKIPRKKNGTRVWMTSCPEARGREFWWFLEKAVSWDLNLGVGSPAEGYEMLGQWVCWVSELRLNSGPASSAGSWLKEDVGTVSVVKIVSLSSYRKTKRQKKY